MNMYPESCAKLALVPIVLTGINAHENGAFKGGGSGSGSDGEGSAGGARKRGKRHSKKDSQELNAKTQRMLRGGSFQVITLQSNCRELLEHQACAQCGL